MLDIPQPSRSRLILEIAADMQDAYEHFIDQGLDKEQAVRKTIEAFDMSADDIASIAEVHDSPLRRFLDRFSSRTRGILEGTALVLALMPVALIGYRMALSGGLSEDSGMWKWPLLAAALAALALGVSKWYKLFVVKEHHIRRVRKRINSTLYIAIGHLAVGFTGIYVDLFEVWEMSSAEKIKTTLYLAQWLQRSSALLTTAMIAALVSGMIWIFNSGKAASIEQYEAELITDPEGESTCCT
jgi:hypothetical protein